MKLRTRHIHALDLLMLGLTDSQTAERIGVTPATFCRWKADPVFQAEWQRRRDAMLQQGADRALSMIRKADQVLEEIMDDKTAPPSTRVAAAAHVHKIMHDMDARMSKAERSAQNLIIQLSPDALNFLLQQYGSKESASEEFAQMIRAAARDVKE